VIEGIQAGIAESNPWPVFSMEIFNFIVYCCFLPKKGDS
jgi:hypothetical protein